MNGARSPVAWPLTAVAIAAGLILVAAAGGKADRPPATSEVSWQGLAGGARPRVSVGQRMIVVLRPPSLAQRVAAAGGLVSDAVERRWTAAALASQRLVLSKLAVRGIQIKPEFSYTRTLNGFSAVVDARAVALIERQEEVEGVYPVRPAFPAEDAATQLRRVAFGAGRGHRVEVGLPGFDGRGVTIALLDTGVDRAHPFLRARIREGVDIVGGSELALAAPRPDRPGEIERHGTQLAGILVGAAGPAGLSGVANGGWVLPIRVAGWQRDAGGRWAVFGRTDQVLAGLERAVDPNDDGDAHDAARIALIGVAETFAGFASGPLARAAAGALALDTLVIAPAGNDGSNAGRGYGTIGGPGGAPAVLTVGAADLRQRSGETRVVIRAGLETIYSGRVALAGFAAPENLVQLELAAPEAAQDARMSEAASTIRSLFTTRGYSLVASRAALVPAGDSPQRAVEQAARAGAAAVLLYGGRLPGGALGLDEHARIPVFGIPVPAATKVIGALSRGATASVFIGPARVDRNPDLQRVAGFSSSGLAFDGRVKPELVAPGVGVATSLPGASENGSARYGTMNGSSAAAAIVAGAAAVLAQARPALGAEAIKSLLVGSAKSLPSAAIPQQGAGLLDLGGAAATEIGAEPTTLALGQATRVSWQTARTLRIRNESSRWLRLDVFLERRVRGAAGVSFSISPDRFVIGPGKTRKVDLEAVVTTEPIGTRSAEGAIVVKPTAGAVIRIPWTITFGRARTNLLRAVSLRTRAFKPSDQRPALLTVWAGRVVKTRAGDQVRPVARLDVELLTSSGDSLGYLARLRNVLPGRLALGITGRDPEGAALPPGRYRLRLTAHPTGRGAPSRRLVPFRIK